MLGSEVGSDRMSQSANTDRANNRKGSYKLKKIHLTKHIMREEDPKLTESLTMDKGIRELTQLSSRDFTGSSNRILPKIEESKQSVKKGSSMSTLDYHEARSDQLGKP